MAPNPELIHSISWPRLAPITLELEHLFTTTLFHHHTHTPTFTSTLFHHYSIINERDPSLFSLSNLNCIFISPLSSLLKGRPESTRCCSTIQLFAFADSFRTSSTYRLLLDIPMPYVYPAFNSISEDGRHQELRRTLGRSGVVMRGGTGSCDERLSYDQE